MNSPEPHPVKATGWPNLVVLGAGCLLLAILVALSLVQLWLLRKPEGID